MKKKYYILGLHAQAYPGIYMDSVLELLQLIEIADITKQLSPSWGKRSYAFLASGKLSELRIHF